MTGRKKDPVWSEFTSTEDNENGNKRAKCRKCGLLMVPLVARMKIHLNKCKNYVSVPSEEVLDLEVLEVDLIENGKFYFMTIYVRTFPLIQNKIFIQTIILISAIK